MVATRLKYMFCKSLKIFDNPLIMRFIVYPEPRGCSALEAFGE